MNQRKSLKELNLLDKFLLDEAMDDPENVKTMLDIILLNTRGKHPELVSPELIELFKYMERSTDEVSGKCKSKRIQEMHRRVCQIKASEKTEVKYMQTWEEYLNELSRDMLDYNYQIWTGNHMLDMILNQKEKEAEKQKTQMQISTEVFTTLPFSDREIISLFGNLLDNALEACEQIKEGERWIHIKMKKKNQLLYIEIVNAAKNTGIQTDENFVSKKDGMLHGYGMKNIRDIVEQYNGMFQCKSQEDRFEVVITIYG